MTTCLVRKREIGFNNDSESANFGRSGSEADSLSFNIFPVKKTGCIDGICFYSNKMTKPHEFHDRNRDIYLDAIAQKIDLFPIVDPRKKQRELYPTEPFPDKEQGVPLEKALGIYIKANPDPHPRLVIISAVPFQLETTLQTFLSIASQYAEPVRLEV